MTFRAFLLFLLMLSILAAGGGSMNTQGNISGVDVVIGDSEQFCLGDDDDVCVEYKPGQGNSNPMVLELDATAPHLYLIPKDESAGAWSPPEFNDRTGFFMWNSYASDNRYHMNVYNKDANQFQITNVGSPLCFSGTPGAACNETNEETDDGNYVIFQGSGVTFWADTYFETGKWIKVLGDMKFQGGDAEFNDNIDLCFGVTNPGDNDACLEWRTTETPNTMVWKLEDANPAMLYVDTGEAYPGGGWNHAAETDPTLILQGDGTDSAGATKLRYDEALAQGELAVETGDLFFGSGPTNSFVFAETAGIATDQSGSYDDPTIRISATATDTSEHMLMSYDSSAGRSDIRSGSGGVNIQGALTTDWIELNSRARTFYDVQFQDNNKLIIGSGGSSTDAVIKHASAGAPDTLIVTPAEDSNYIAVVSNDDQDVALNVAQSSDPAILMCGQDINSDQTEYMRLQYDSTDDQGEISVGKGDLELNAGDGGEILLGNFATYTSRHSFSPPETYTVSTVAGFFGPTLFYEFNADADKSYFDMIIGEDWDQASDWEVCVFWANESGNTISDGETVVHDFLWKTQQEGDPMGGIQASTSVTYTQSGAGTDHIIHYNCAAVDYDHGQQGLTPGDLITFAYNFDQTSSTYDASAVGIRVTGFELNYVANKIDSSGR